MSNYNKLKLDLGDESFIILDYREAMTLLSIIEAMKQFHRWGKKHYTIKQLAKKTREVRKNPYVTKEIIIRMIKWLIGRHLHIIQVNKYRFIFPTKDFIKNNLEEKNK
ncbi:hypothetical protein GOV04_05025 [Candidatus Woesearchaeota archaeon]|nr:hypothetical protein [Candidatus Woesearchaeota archaeon]